MEEDPSIDDKSDKDKKRDAHLGFCSQSKERDGNTDFQSPQRAVCFLPADLSSMPGLDAATAALKEVLGLDHLKEELNDTEDDNVKLEVELVEVKDWRIEQIATAESEIPSYDYEVPVVGDVGAGADEFSYTVELREDGDNLDSSSSDEGDTDSGTNWSGLSEEGDIKSGTNWSEPSNEGDIKSGTYWPELSDEDVNEEEVQLPGQDEIQLGGQYETELPGRDKTPILVPMETDWLEWPDEGGSETQTDFSVQLPKSPAPASSLATSSRGR